MLNLWRTIFYDHCCEGRVVRNGQSRMHRLYVRVEDYANQVKETSAPFPAEEATSNKRDAEAEEPSKIGPTIMFIERPPTGIYGPPW
jgi:hypothetical protein